MPLSTQIPVEINSYRTDPYHSDISTADTIHKMVSMTLVAAKSPLIASVLQSCLKSAIAIDGTTSTPAQVNKVRCMYWWVKRNIKFVEDEQILKLHLAELGYTDEILNTPQGAMDLLISPEVLLSMNDPMGDCDDYSMLLASLLIAGGIRVWFVTIAADDMEPERYSHVYLKAYVADEGKYITLDASHGQYPGWEARRYFRRAEWNIN